MSIKGKFVDFFSLKKVLNNIEQENTKNRKLSEKEISELQTVLLEIYADIFHACEKNDIKPILQGGTLLGYKRHKGFIPWDDDLDLGMLRKDYEKFKKIFDTELSENYILKGPGCREGATNRFIQVFKKNTVFSTVDMAEDTPHMISIDIFPIDYVPNGKWQQKIKGVYCNILMIFTSCVEFKKHMNNTLKAHMIRTLQGKINLKIRMFLGRCLSFKSLDSWYQKVDKSIQTRKKTKFVTSATGRKHYLGEIIAADSMVPLKKTKFCGLDAWIPAKPDDYLRNLYGDTYMEIPPESKRESHFILELKY